MLPFPRHICSAIIPSQKDVSTLLVMNLLRLLIAFISAFNSIPRLHVLLIGINSRVIAARNSHVNGICHFASLINSRFACSKCWSGHTRRSGMRFAKSLRANLKQRKSELNINPDKASGGVLCNFSYSDKALQLKPSIACDSITFRQTTDTILVINPQPNTECEKSFARFFISILSRAINFHV